MLRLTVLYGHPDSPEEFDRYYHDVHLPIARKMEGLRGWTIAKCSSIDPNEPPPYYLMVGLYFDSLEHMNEVLSSEAGQAAVADVPNFATGGAKFMTSEEDVLVPFSLG